MSRRILVVNHEFPPLEGGGANASFFISRALVRRGWAIDVVTADLGQLPNEERIEGVAVHRARGRRRGHPAGLLDLGEFVLSGSRLALRITAQVKPAAVIAFFALPAGLVGLRIRARRDIPLIISLRGTDVPGNNPETFRLAHQLTAPLTRWVLRRADSVTAVSDELGDVARRFDPTLRIEIVPNGVDAARFTPDPGRPEGPVRLLSVGQTIARKGHDTLIRALPALLSRTGVDVRVVIVGRKGPDQEALSLLARDLGVGERVEIRDAVPREAMPDVYREADVLVHLSVCEGMSNVVLEGMASALPVVATPVGGMAALVQSGLNGVLVSVGSATEVAKALSPLVTDLGLRKQYGNKSRERAEALSWEASAGRYEAIVLESMARRQGA